MNGLHRSRRQRIVAGVCGGLAESFGVPVWLVRLLFLLAMLPGGVPGVLLYVVLWIALPTRRVTHAGRALGAPVAPLDHLAGPAAAAPRAHSV